MPSTKIYMVYAAAGIATFAGSMNGVPTFSHELNLDGMEVAAMRPYQTDNDNPDAGPYSTVQTAKAGEAYPKRGETLLVSAKTKLGKSVPTLEKEKYNFEIYEG